MPKKTTAPCKIARSPEQKKTYKNDIIITGNVAWRDDISWAAKILYGIIRGLAKNDFYCCYASNEYLCEKLQKGDDSTVRRYLRKLENLGFIKRGYAYVKDEFGEVYRARALIPTDLLKQFERVQDEVQDLKKSSKKCPKTVQNCTGDPCKNARQIINMYPYSTNKPLTSIEVDTNPQTPLQGGNQKATLVEPEQFELVGKDKNVRLTASQRTALSGEFGADLAQSLIEQLSAWIASGVKRLRKKADHYSILRDWGLRRTQPKKLPAAARAIVGGQDIERRNYSDDEIATLFTDLDDG